MKKKIVIISIVWVGFIFALTGNSWAAREKGGHRNQDRGGHYQKWNKHADNHYYKGNHGPSRHRAPRHFKPRHNRRYHRPAYRKAHPQRYHRRAPHPVVRQINNYYGSVESDSAPEDDYQVTASISDAEFSFSIGVSGSR